MTSTDLATRQHEASGFELAERMFTPRRRQAIARFLNVEPDEPALLPYLSVCAKYRLDPVMGEIWLIPQRVKVRDAEGKVAHQDRYKPAAGRDGYLSIARRDARYRGLKGAVVCEHDTFEVAYDGSPDEPTVLHRFASKPVAFDAGEAPDRYRGRILGAWAKAYAEGLPPLFYFAGLREHGKLQEKWEGPKSNRHRVLDSKGNVVMEWAGSWSYTSSMILKAAQSYVLRIQFGISGLSPMDELRDPSDPDGGLIIDTSGSEEREFEFDSLNASDELIGRLRTAVAVANEYAPLSWAPAKCEMVMGGRSEEELEGIADALEHEAELLANRAGRAAGARAQQEDEPQGQAEEAVEDAVVVELSEEDRERIDGLEHRAADLRCGIDEAEPGGEEYASLSAELDQVEAQIAAVRNPRQDSLEL